MKDPALEILLDSAKVMHSATNSDPKSDEMWDLPMEHSMDLNIL